MMHKRLGFTLIELLVVIAIIAILAAILFPVFVSAQSKAKMTSCQSNMKQTLSAMHAYMNDWNDYFPMVVVDNPPADMSPNDVYWGLAIRSYCGKKPEMIYCPSVPATFLGVDGGWASGGGINYQFYAYPTIGMNLAFQVDKNGYWSGPKRLGQLGAASKTLLVADASQYRYMSGGNKWGAAAICPGSQTDPVLGNIRYINPAPAYYTKDFFDPARHSGWINVGLADGHAAAKQRKWLLTPQATDKLNRDYTWWDLL